MIVVLKSPSLADRVAALGGKATEAQEQKWTSYALAQQRLLLSRLEVQGVRIQPDFSFGRVLAGFSALLDPTAVSLLERDHAVQGVYPVRVAYPSSISSDASRAGRSRPRSATQTCRCRATTGAESPSRCSTRASIARTLRCSAVSRRASTSSIRRATRRRRRRPGGRVKSSVTARSWRASSPATGPARESRRRARSERPADPRRRLAAGRPRRLRDLRADGSAHRRPRARGRPEHERRRPRRRPRGARRRGGAVRGLCRRSCGACNRRRGTPEHARRGRCRERRAGRSRLRQHLRSRRLARGADGRRGGHALARATGAGVAPRRTEGRARPDAAAERRVRTRAGVHVADRRARSSRRGARRSPARRRTSRATA